MARIQADRVNRGTPRASQTEVNESEQDRRFRIKRKQQWPAVAIVATHRYLSEGVRILGEAYTTYDDRGPQ